MKEPSYNNEEAKKNILLISAAMKDIADNGMVVYKLEKIFINDSNNIENGDNTLTSNRTIVNPRKAVAYACTPKDIYSIDSRKKPGYLVLNDTLDYPLVRDDIEVTKDNLPRFFIDRDKAQNTTIQLNKDALAVEEEIKRDSEKNILFLKKMIETESF